MTRIVSDERALISITLLLFFLLLVQLLFNSDTSLLETERAKGFRKGRGNIKRKEEEHMYILS